MHLSRSSWTGVFHVSAFVLLAVLARAQSTPRDEGQLALSSPAPAVALEPPALDKLAESKCFACHADIVTEWASTAHALAWLDTDYQDALADRSKPETCYGCHIPGSLAGADLKAKPAPREEERRFGVSCESCHVDAAGVVHGPRGTQTNAHSTVLDARLVAPGSNELCASCHRTNIGPVVGIAQDFETAKMAERGKSCVGCHLQRVEARFAGTSNGVESPLRTGRSHALQTPRDPAFLKLAFALTTRVADGQTIVTVSNQAGHRVPGLIGRTLTFDAHVLDANGQETGSATLVVDAANYLPVDGSLEIVVPALGSRVHVTGRHLDPRAIDPVVFQDTDIEVAAGDSTALLGALVAEDDALVHGALTSRYYGRWGAGYNDQNLLESLELDIGRSDRAGWSGSVVLDVQADLDGREGGGSPFSSLDDTYDQAVQLRVYEAHADYRGDTSGSFVRIGRQSDSETPAQIWYDGVRVEHHSPGRQELLLGLYGGRPARFYDDSAKGDVTGGAYAGMRPWRGAEVRLDWLHLEDEQSLGTRQNDLIALGGRQTFGERALVVANASWLEAESRDASLRATWNDPENDLVFEARGYQLFHAQNMLAQELDPFTDVLMEQVPYREGRLLASKGLGRHVRVEGEYDQRDLDDQGDESTFNHGFERVYAGLALIDALPAGVRFSLGGERWNSDSNDIDTWSASLSKEFAPRLEAAIGSGYALYVTDVSSGEERSNVRSWYARLRSHPSTGLTWDLRYEFDDGDEYDTNSIRAGATWRF